MLKRPVGRGHRRTMRRPLQRFPSQRTHWASGGWDEPCRCPPRHRGWRRPRGGSLVLFGDGRQTRDFVYLDDIVDALRRPALQGVPVAAGRTAGISRSIDNIGSGCEVSILQLVEAIEGVLGYGVHRLHNTGEKVGVTRLAADLRLARETLGHTPRVSLEERLRLTNARDRRCARR